MQHMTVLRQVSRKRRIRSPRAAWRSHALGCADTLASGATAVGAEEGVSPKRTRTTSSYAYIFATPRCNVKTTKKNSHTDLQLHNPTQCHDTRRLGLHVGQNVDRAPRNGRGRRDECNADDRGRRDASNRGRGRGRGRGRVATPGLTTTTNTVLVGWVI